jgi:hypothetical protein
MLAWSGDLYSEKAEPDHAPPREASSSERGVKPGTEGHSLFRIPSLRAPRGRRGTSLPGAQYDIAPPPGG